MTTSEIAEAFTALCKAGELDDAGEQFWAPDVRSIEPFEGEAATSVGLDAVRAKGEWWYGAHDVHSVDVEGPYVNGDQFTVRFTMDITVKESGNRTQMEEIALYTVADGKISEERFFYNM
jgi:ketosteroid isomerase-like protein